MSEPVHGCPGVQDLSRTGPGRQVLTAVSSMSGCASGDAIAAARGVVPSLAAATAAGGVYPPPAAEQAAAAVVAEGYSPLAHCSSGGGILPRDLEQLLLRGGVPPLA